MPWTVNKAVVPIDFSENSAPALRAALEFVASPADVHAVHILPALEAVSPGVVWGDVTDEKREAHLRRHFDQYLARLGISGITTDVRIGDAGLEVADYAKEIGADLIVMPTHGYHGIKRLMLGSVTERVLRHASCHVLVLRRTDAE